MTEAPAIGSQELKDVVNTNIDYWEKREVFLLQHPRQPRKFLKFNRTRDTNNEDEANGEWASLPSGGTEEDNEEILSKFCCVCNGHGGIMLLPGPRNGKMDDTMWPYIIYFNDKFVYRFDDNPAYDGGKYRALDINGSKKYDGMGAVLKFKSGHYYKREPLGNSKGPTLAKNATQFNFLKVSDMTVGNFDDKTGTNIVLDFINATKKIDRKDAIAHDFEQDRGPCPYNMITTEIEGHENCSKYFKQDTRYTMANGEVSSLAPGADVVLPCTTLSLLGEQYDINRYRSDKKFEFNTFYFFGNSAGASKDKLTKFIEEGGAIDKENPQRLKVYQELTNKVCSYDDNTFYEFDYGTEKKNCSEIIYDEQQLIDKCTSNNARLMMDGKPCSKANMGPLWQTATEDYCSKTENMTGDERCKMYLIQGVGKALEICKDVDESERSEWCKDLLDSNKKTRSKYDKEKKKGNVVVGMTKDNYVNGQLLNEFYEKWDNPDWRDPDFVRPTVNFCQQQTKVRNQNADINSACEIHNTETEVGAADGDDQDASIESKEKLEINLEANTSGDDDDDDDGGLLGVFSSSDDGDGDEEEDYTSLFIAASCSFISLMLFCCCLILVLMMVGNKK